MHVDSTPLGDPRLEAAWRAWQEAGHVSSPFLSWEWFSALRDVPSLARSVRVLLVSDARMAPVGLLPLEWRPGPGLARTVGLATWWWATPDHLDIVGPPSSRPAAAAAIADHLAGRHDWELLDIDGVLRTSPLIQALDDRLGRPAFWRRDDEDITCAFADLDAAEGLGNVPSKNTRKQVRRDFLHATELGGSLEALTSPAEVLEALDELVPAHVAYWGSRSSVFATPERVRFHRLAASRLADSGHACVYRLTAGGETEALLYALHWAGTVAFYVSARRQDGLLHSPGVTLRAKVIETAATAGLRRVDLLRGEHAYKERFATSTQHDLRAQYLRAGWRLAATGVEKLFHRASDVVSRRLA